ncbi:NAD(P)H-dependent oxidoreductase [Zavarzinia sp. CC-PAN008]|uniref:NAD(P)H-dependent oxidoreductase n=1 Tax=Zavarzinia sp. CC-PAN008 TaxID=3243332 RepID=UPI003F7433AB
MRTSCCAPGSRGTDLHALVVLAHPDADSFSRAAADQVAAGLAAAGHTSELADLAAEGFDPRTSAADLRHYRGDAAAPADVAAEHGRIDRADGLVFVFPIYWWSLPALLKGWVDRVLTNGFAYGYTAEGRLLGLLRDRPVRVLAIGAGDLGSFERHGYDTAIQTQITRGIFGYCGITQARTDLLLDVEARDPGVRDGLLAQAFATGRDLFGPG